MITRMDSIEDAGWLERFVRFYSGVNVRQSLFAHILVLGVVFAYALARASTEPYPETVALVLEMTVITLFLFILIPIVWKRNKRRINKNISETDPLTGYLKRMNRESSDPNTAVLWVWSQSKPSPRQLAPAELSSRQRRDAIASTITRYARFYLPHSTIEEDHIYAEMEARRAIRNLVIAIAQLEDRERQGIVRELIAELPEALHARRNMYERIAELPERLRAKRDMSSRSQVRRVVIVPSEDPKLVDRCLADFVATYADLASHEDTVASHEVAVPG